MPECSTPWNVGTSKRNRVEQCMIYPDGLVHVWHACRRGHAQLSRCFPSWFGESMHCSLCLKPILNFVGFANSLTPSNTDQARNQLLATLQNNRSQIQIFTTENKMLDFKKKKNNNLDAVYMLYPFQCIHQRRSFDLKWVGLIWLCFSSIDFFAWTSFHNRSFEDSSKIDGKRKNQIARLLQGRHREQNLMTLNWTKNQNSDFK